MLIAHVGDPLAKSPWPKPHEVSFFFSAFPKHIERTPAVMMYVASCIRIPVKPSGQTHKPFTQVPAPQAFEKGWSGTQLILYILQDVVGSKPLKQPNSVPSRERTLEVLCAMMSFSLI